MVSHVFCLVILLCIFCIGTELRMLNVNFIYAAIVVTGQSCVLSYLFYFFILPFCIRYLAEMVVI